MDCSEVDSATDIVVVVGAHRVPLPAGTPEGAVVRALATTPDRTGAGLAGRTGLPDAAVRAAVHRLDGLGLIRHAVVADGVRLLDLEPMTGRPSSWGPAPRWDGGAVVLSRFALLRADGGVLVAESPRSCYRARLAGPPVLDLLHRLAAPEGLAAPDGDGPVAECLRLLVHAGLAVPVAAGPELPGWDFHDLLFHTRSRPGAHDYPVGRTYPLAGGVPPLPAVPPRRGTGRREPLDPVDLAAVAARDPAFTTVLERRRSVRTHRAGAMDRAALGEFLFRCARVRRLVPADPDQGIRYPSSDRPYPSGGGAYELEIYPVVGRCAGLEPGVYHYAAEAHALDRVADAGTRCAAVLRAAAAGAAVQGPPAVLLAVTSRFARLSWKYGGMAYATTLKNLGVLYQTMYLVATAMGLAPCAVGTGDPARWSGLLGRPATDEPLVGEFLLGGRPPDRAG